MYPIAVHFIVKCPMGSCAESIFFILKAIMQQVQFLETIVRKSIEVTSKSF